MKAIAFSLLIVTALFVPRAFSSPDPAVSEHIRWEVEVLGSVVNPTLGGEAVAALPLLEKFYSERNFEPAWQGAQQTALVQAFQESADDGLNPEDYHLRAILQRMDEASRVELSAVRRAELDILLTEGVIRLVRHLELGKVDPADLNSDWRFRKPFDDEHFLRDLQRIAESDNPAALLGAHRPHDPIYRRTKEALARYREIARRGSWPLIQNGLPLKLGSNDMRVEEIRARLLVTGELDPAAAHGRQFDAAVDSAVRKFQTRHFLIPDGIVGPVTLEQLNVPVEQRIEQLRVNLERARWVLHETQGRFILVDIAGFMVYDVNHGRIDWSSRAVVGKPYRETPEFKSKINHLVLNPTWTVPPTVLSNDVLPTLKRDPDYLRRNNMVVLDRNWKVVNPYRIDWSRYSGASFPYIIRQESGPQNALGRIKFMFPNPYSVYLHDTPSRNLFGWDRRAFSSGCIRIEKPLELAERLFGDSSKWSKARIQTLIDTGKTRTIHLEKPVPVILFYWTAAVGPDGEIRFKKDIYNRDRALLHALDRPPTWARAGGQSAGIDKTPSHAPAL